jgi:hypothetical protein
MPPKKRSRAAVGRGSRAKGNAFEVFIATTLNENYGDPALMAKDREFYRTPLSGGMVTHYPGDIVVPENFRFMIECKKRETIGDLYSLVSLRTGHPILKWFLSEEPKALKIHKELLLIFARNYGEPLVLFRYKPWIGLSGCLDVIEPASALFIRMAKKLVPVHTPELLVLMTLEDFLQKFPRPVMRPISIAVPLGVPVLPIATTVDQTTPSSFSGLAPTTQTITVTMPAGSGPSTSP